MTKKILVADPIAEQGVALLRERGYDVDVRLGLSPEEVVEVIAPYDALIVRATTPVTREVIEAGENLRIIGRAGVTIDTIDVEAATEHGVLVCNAPTSNIVSTAEHTMALMLAAARKLPQSNASMHAGKWEQSCYMGVELSGKTLAIIGIGRVGSLVAERAAAFDMNLVGYDPYCSRDRAEQLGVTLYETVDEILPIADIITVHVPRTAKTMGLFGPQEYAKMKDGVILLNTARYGVYDEKAMADFMAAGKIGAVGIDMHAAEPCYTSPLHEFPNAVLTPRQASATREAQCRAAEQIAEYVAAGLEGSLVPTAVNMAPMPPEVIDTLGPYVSACEMMGRVVAQIKGDIPKRIKVTAAGAVSGNDPSVLVAGVLGGVLAYRRAGTVTTMNAESVAARHGITTETAALTDAEEYASSVTVVADGIEMGTTLFGSTQVPRIVSLLGYKIDIVPAKECLVFEYVDAPGRVGIIGTILGNAGVNITTMQIGTKEAEETALVVMNVEGDVTDEVIASLREAVELKNLWFITL